jgi:hypothetical protein
MGWLVRPDFICLSLGQNQLGVDDAQKRYSTFMSIGMSSLEDHPSLPCSVAQSSKSDAEGRL